MRSLMLALGVLATLLVGGVIVLTAAAWLGGWPDVIEANRIVEGWLR